VSAWKALCVVQPDITALVAARSVQRGRKSSSRSKG